MQQGHIGRRSDSNFIKILYHVYCYVPLGVRTALKLAENDLF
jgi:hypothetical protein